MENSGARIEAVQPAQRRGAAVAAPAQWFGRGKSPFPPVLVRAGHPHV